MEMAGGGGEGSGGAGDGGGGDGGGGTGDGGGEGGGSGMLQLAEYWLIAKVGAAFTSGSAQEPAALTAPAVDPVWTRSIL